MRQWGEFISRVDVFSALGSKERESLLAQAQEREIRRKQALFTAQSPANHVYVIMRGALKTVRERETEKRLLLDFVKAGELLGEDSALFSGEYEMDAIPLEGCCALALPADNVRRVLDTHPRFGRALAALSASRARAYRERLYAMTTTPVPHRLAALLCQLARRFGKRDRKGTLITLKVTHQDLADYVGASRETVTIFLAEFKDKGLIATDVRKIIVPDLKAMKKIYSA